MSVHFLLQEIHKVNVLGAVIAIIADADGQPMVPIHPVVDVIGINFDEEYQRLRNDRRFGASRLTVRTAQGEVIEEIVVPLTKLHAFLFSIDSSKVSGEAAARLELFRTSASTC